MTFPIAERRLTLGDRRSQQDRRNNNVPVQRDLRSARGDRRGGKERRYLHLDREALLNNLFLPSFQERESAFIKGLRLLLLPVVIATVSAFVTYNINMRQIQSAEIIADSQRRSAEEIAEANREHTAQIADAELETQRLEQIIGIFTDIIKEGSKEKHDSVSLDFVKQEIASLEVYEDQAFPFLIKLREYQGRDDKYQKTVNDTANISIQEILKNSQLQFPQAEFIGTKDEILDLRHRKYMRYNLKEAEFKHVNLHGADFSHSTLCGANFEEADLSNVNFSGANLKEAKFSGESLNLRETDFRGAYLRGATFESNEKITDAIFSWKALKYPVKPPFVNLEKRYYLKLLARYKDTIKKEAEEKPNELGKFYEKLGINTFEELLEEFEELEELEELVK